MLSKKGRKQIMAMMSSNGALFMGAISTQDKEFLKPLLVNARKSGYERFIEPCAGALACSYLAVEAGFDPKKIEASDISYFSGVFGRAMSEQPLDAMEIKAEGFTEEELRDYATALYAQLYLRSVSKGGKDYFYEILKDLKYRRSEHIAKIQQQIDEVKSKCKGLTYYDMDLMEHIRRIKDDEKAVAILWAPTYKAGYEKFFDTQGRLHWHEPSYGVFDPEQGIHDLYDLTMESKALIIIGQERPAGECVGEPIYGRDSGREGVYRYLTSNRPEEAKRLATGKGIDRKNGAKMNPLKKPIIPYDYKITKKSVVDVIPIKAENATYYRRLWTHNFVGGASGSCLAVIADGYVVGVFGYDKFTMSLGDGADLFIKFCISAPNIMRTNRLLYMFGSNKEIAYQYLNDIQKENTKGIMTTMITKHKVNMEVRGLMKMISRVPDGKNGYKLQYRCDMKDRTKEETLREWLQKEEARQKTKNCSEN